MKRSEALPGKTLAQSDIPRPKLVTVDRVEIITMKDMDTGADKDKATLFFVEFEKGLVLNHTNWDVMEEATGSDDTDGWTGAKVVIYTDPSIRFGSKVTGGLRLRLANDATTSPADIPAEGESPAPQGDDSIPF